MAMVVGPPRLLMLAAIAVASCLFVFTQFESGVREERYGGWRKRELGYGDGGGVWRPVQAWRQLLPYSAPRVVYHGSGCCSPYEDEFEMCLTCKNLSAGDSWQRLPVCHHPRRVPRNPCCCL